MFERYTEKARRVIFFARYEASQFGSPYIETEHLLLGLLREDKALAHRFLGDETVSQSIRKQIEERTTVREKVSTSVDLPLTHECKRVLAYGAEEAERLNHKHIGTGHLLLGLLREEKSLAAEILHQRGLRLSAVREEIAHSVVAPVTDASNLELARQYLEALNQGVRDLSKFWDPEATQKGFPPIAPNAAEQEQKPLLTQSYIILREVAAGNLVALEVLWEGTLATSFQSFLPGQTLQAHFAVFLEFRNGKIIAQRNYEGGSLFPGE